LPATISLSAGVSLRIGAALLALAVHTVPVALPKMCREVAARTAAGHLLACAQVVLRNL
jgi:hypothetical protein